MNRRLFCQTGAGALAAAALSSNLRGQTVSYPPHAAFAVLPLGELLPTGWLRRQLRLQADGMGGHLDEFWPDVGANSGWLGGNGESWERGPYFLDGLLPLAWLLDDTVLKAKAMRWVNWTLDHQAADGMIGPTSNDDWWPRMVMCKVLMQYHEATQDPRVIPVLTRYYHHQLAALPARPLREWGKYRWQDAVLVIEWLHGRTGDPLLLQLALLLQQQGHDWTAQFGNFKTTEPVTRAVLGRKDAKGEEAEALSTHGVNNGQALKVAAVRYRLSGDPAERTNFAHQLAMLDTYHGMPNGMFSCDEHLGGLDPSHGTELCTVVETMYSLEVALETFGDAWIGDRIEAVAYNALPGTFTDDMWAHQYDQQPNQIQCGLNSKPWTTNGVESNLYGLEPHFGCCTANFHQGWPKLTEHLWMHTPDGGLAATVYAPCEVNTTVQGAVPVHLRVETEYPFRETVRITVSPAQATSFPLLLRIPAWTQAAAITVNGKASDVACIPGSFTRLQRTWTAGDVVEVRLPMQPRVTRGFHRSLTVHRGPLVFSYSPGETWVKLRDRPPTADWQVFPQRTWNYAMRVDETSAPKLKVMERPVPARPFAAEGTPVRIEVEAKLLNGWRSADGVAGPVPVGLQESGEAEETLTLVPYAAAKLRITAFPQLGA